MRHERDVAAVAYRRIIDGLQTFLLMTVEPANGDEIRLHEFHIGRTGRFYDFWVGHVQKIPGLDLYVVSITETE